MRVGIVGCGKQALKHIQGLLSLPDVKITVMDENPSLAKELAERYTGVDWVNDYMGFYNVDAVVICTPIYSHYPLLIKAHEYQQNVFCEKPLCQTLNQSQHIKDLFGDGNKFVQVGYAYRYVPVFEEMHRILRESMILDNPIIAVLRAGGRGGHQEWKHQHSTGGGAINEMLVHMLDLALWLFGPIDEVKPIDKKIYLARRQIGTKVVECDAEDFILIHCRNISGLDIYIEADLVTPAFSQYVEVQAENGSLFGSIQRDVPSYVFLKNSRGGYEAGKTLFGSASKRNIFDAQIADFIYHARKGKRPTRNTIDDSIKLMKLVEEIKKW